VGAGSGVPVPRPLVREAAGERATALDDLQQAVTLHEQLDQPFELGRTLLAHGAALRRAKHKALARSAFDRAAAIFDGLPAPQWRDRFAAESARLGAPAGSPWALTATEHRIADLVASGRSNREVAAELFLSPKTVEWNLSKVYRKLGLRSRSELAGSWSSRRRLASGEVPGSSGDGRP
jgi:DNA-binding CsgD family transcriptional regulator